MYIHSFIGSVPTWIIIKYWIEFPVLYSRLLLAIQFTYSKQCAKINPNFPIIPPEVISLNLLNSILLEGFPSSSVGKESICNAGDHGPIPGWRRFPLEKEQATHSSIPGLPCWFSWQRIHLQCGRPGFNPWVGKIPWRREQLPTPVFWPGEFYELCSPWGHNDNYHQNTAQLATMVLSYFSQLQKCEESIMQCKKSLMEQILETGKSSLSFENDVYSSKVAISVNAINQKELTGKSSERMDS